MTISTTTDNDTPLTPVEQTLVVAVWMLSEELERLAAKVNEIGERESGNG